MIKLVHHEMVINSKFLEVPRSYYQRTLNANRVKRIAAEFDERIANAPKVSYRNGHYYVFDGQHTIAHASCGTTTVILTSSARYTPV